VTHPYRERPAGEPIHLSPEARLDAASVVFGLCCAILGEALAGPACALFATVVGVALLLGSPRR
jgi:hypothetical protein